MGKYRNSIKRLIVFEVHENNVRNSLIPFIRPVIFGNNWKSISDYMLCIVLNQLSSSLKFALSVFFLGWNSSLGKVYVHDVELTI